jgi:4-hydroxybenzoate polyprenyltransferase
MLAELAVSEQSPPLIRPAAHSHWEQRVRPWIALLRPRQWTKNGLVFVGLLFSLSLTQLPLVVRCCLAFVVLCLLASGTYIVNDVLDAPRDRLHPTKRRRPIAAGRIGPGEALALAALLLVGSLLLAWWLGHHFLAVGVTYLLLTFSYSLWLKHYPIVDVLTIAAGFVLRAAAGAILIDVPISPWLLGCTFLGALLIALGKRRNELLTLEGQALAHRGSLEGLTVEFLDQLSLMMASASIVFYALYTFFVQPSYPPWLMLTIPVVIYGIFRYLYLVRVEGHGGSPEELLLTDRPLLGTVVLWVLLSALTLYGDRLVPFLGPR